ncbi:alpha/beta fold hydrolase [Pseudoalteromonas xiamenensis]|uniref:Alpha/beta fold hydrolase n=1 Tax=Pseudoalteromonas xiamenensis TaxID=882626 RepID=A0A975HL05_9GAMM|nr:alpha/beta fold hydrolase [Pseudoalteromonas xiamenensis]QTH71529.1 alpha/beta fold hydrolase [Pseudoalteromonas xiamenensis]
MLLNYKLTQATNQTSTLPVVLLHGLFGSLENLNIIGKALGENYDIINMDLRNHGLSPHAATHNYPSLANDVVETLKGLNIEKAYIVGHSMGGKVAMQIAHRHPDMVAKLVVLDIAPVAYHSRHDAIFSALNAVANVTISSRTQADEIMSVYIKEMGVRQFLLKSLQKNDSGEFNWRFNLDVLSAQYQNILTNIDANDSCLCETLFVKGSESDYILVEHRDVIAKLFPNSKGRVVHGAGHWLHAEKPLVVNKAIIDFLQ